MRTLLICIFLATFMVSCSCGDTNSEVLVRLDFETGIEPVFTKITASGANRPISPERIRSNNINTANYYVPISSIQDSTLIFFERPDRKDTLLVRYKRNFNYNRDACGFYMDVQMLDPGKNTLSNRAYGLSGSSGFLFGGVIFEPSISFRD